ncbi:MAG: DUF29 domain-containing protein [Deltaproteobacteria bacterium]|jgi:Domain of unknown function DUF29
MLYEQDFYQWTQEQTELMKAGALSQLDIPNLIEEIESMGRSEKRELRSRLTVLLMHLLKWDYQTDRRSGSWKSTINTQRMDIDFVLKDNPSLKHNLEIIIDETYRVARQRAADETGLPESVFPLSCPYTVEQIIADATL